MDNSHPEVSASHPEVSASHPEVSKDPEESKGTIEDRVNRAIDKVRPGIQMDGGEVWLLKVENGIAFVQMLGACGGCPASNMTLKGAIEQVVRADVPEITEVVQI